MLKKQCANIIQNIQHTPLYFFLAVFFSFALWSIYTPLLTNESIEHAYAATTVTVGASGDTYTTIAAALTAIDSASSTDYVIEVQSDYAAAAEPAGTGILDMNTGGTGNITLTCQTPATTVGSSTYQFTFDFTSDATIEDCTFQNVFLRVDNSAQSNITIQNNTFSTSTDYSSIQLRDVTTYSIQNNNALKGIDIRRSTSGTIDSNTVYVVEGGSAAILVGSELDNVLSISTTTISNNAIVAQTPTTNNAFIELVGGANITIATNTLSVETVSSTSKVFLSVLNSIADIQGNVIINTTNVDEDNDKLFNLSANTSTIDSVYTVSDNTCITGGGYCIRYSNNNSANISITSTYNIFYAVPGTTKAYGIADNVSGGTVVSSSDYNGFWNLSTNVGEGTAYPIGANSITKDPFFSNTSTYSALSEFSGYLDVNGTRDIGHISAARVGTIPIGTENLIPDFDTVSTTVRASDTLNFTAGTFDGFSISSLSGLTIDGVGATTIFNAATDSNALSFTSSDSLTLTDFVAQSASSSATTYTATNLIVSYGGNDYGDNVGTGANSTFFANETCSALTSWTADGYDLTSILGTTNNIHVVAGDVGGSNVTVLIRDDYASSIAEVNALCTDVSPQPGSQPMTVESFGEDAFTVSGGVFTYQSGSFSSSSITITGGYTDPPSITRVITRYAGIKLADSDSATITNVTSTGNGYGIWFSGTAASNILNTSTLASSVGYDVFSDSSVDNSIKNTSFTTASSSITGVGEVDVYYRSRAYITGGGSPLAGVPVTYTRADDAASSTLTTAADGYTPFSDFLLAFTMSSSSIATTNGGYNPWTLSAAATTTYALTTTTENLDTQNETVTIAMSSSNSAPTISAAIFPAFATDATGFTTVTTTATDSDGDTLTLFVEYSIDGGSTWASSTIATVSGDGTPATSTGQISSITSTADGNALTFAWDSQADSVTSTATAQIRVRAYDSTVYSSWVTSSNFTADNVAPSTPTFDAPTLGTTSITANWSSVSGASTYTVSSTAASATTTSGTDVAFSSLTPNTAYTFQILATDAYSNASSYSSATTSYTNAVAPSAISASANGQTSIIVSWTDDTNASGSTYELRYSNGTLIGTTTDKTYTISGLSAGTAYTVKVRTQYAGDSSSYSSYTSAASATTAAASSSGGGTISVPAPPPAPTVTAPPAIIETFVEGEPQEVNVGNHSHRVTAKGKSSNEKVKFVIESDPIEIELAEGEEIILDTDSDGVPDLFVALQSIIDDNTFDLELAAIEDLEFSINQARSKTTSRDVTLLFNSPSSVLVALSNDESFTGAGYEPYSASKRWTLSEGNGTKRVYAKLRTAAGGEKILSDTIMLTELPSDELDIEINTTGCALFPNKAYRALGSSAVYYVEEAHNADGTVNTDIACAKRPFSSATMYFTYFDSWDDVVVTTHTALESVQDDELGFMPWGSTYDPKYGALVKVVTDPKVYLLLGTNKHWITSEVVFTGLKYAWYWIEDVAGGLLDKYESAGEITYTDHHPNYTLIKYADDPKVYRLEPDPSDPEQQVKRHIADEAAFEALNFRWDRIVTVPDTEVYEDGEQLTSE